MRSTYLRSRAMGHGSIALRASTLAVIAGAAAFGGDRRCGAGEEVGRRDGGIITRERPGGLLRYYYRSAAWGSEYQRHRESDRYRSRRSLPASDFALG